MDQNMDVPVICKGCGNNSNGNYCTQCGEYLHPERFTIKKIASSIPDVFLEVEHGLFYTIKELFKNPSAAIASFLAGNRSKHYQPLKFVLIMSGLYALLFIYFDIHGVEGVYGGVTDANNAQLLEEQYVKCQSIINVFSLPFLSLLTWLFFRKNMYYGEHLLMNCFIIGIVLFIQVLCFPIMLLKNGTVWVDWINDILTLATVYIAARTYYGLFYEKNKRNLVIAIFKTLIIILTLAFWYFVTSPFIIILKMNLLGE